MNMIDFIAELDCAYEGEDNSSQLTISLVGGISKVPVGSVAFCADCNEFHIYSKLGRQRHEEQHN